MNQFLGQILMVAFSFAPKGWALCNGQLLPISQNQALFELLGTTYGGDGKSTFALPDLRGRVPIHQGQGSGTSSYMLGAKAGTETTTLTTAHLPAHNHAIKVSDAIGANRYGGGSPPRTLAALPDAYMYTTQAPQNALNSATIENAGSGQAFSNVEPFLCVNFIIALQGVFPSQS